MEQATMPQAIRKLRRSFIAIAAASFFAVIAFMAIATSVVNMITLSGQANRTLDAILSAGGKMPTQGDYSDGPFHEEANYGLRYFTVTFDDQGNVTDVDLSHIALVDAAEALEVSQVAADPNSLTGLSQFENFYYKEGPYGDGSMVVFLDCSMQLAANGEVLLNTMLLSVVAFVVTLVSILLFSKRAVRTEVENAHRQQQFITNASHELKTPVAVIRANTELTEMLSGETEWTQSTLAQVDRLDGLVSDLMAIVRGGESADDGDAPGDVDVSAAVGAAVASFESVAQQNGKTLDSKIDPGISLRGRAKTVEQLTCLLVDNAIKYCDEGGSVNVRLSPARIGRGCTLVVSNDYAEGGDVDYRRFFERFYREDESHENQQGYGIGLSVAESICEQYNGSIRASWKAGRISFTCVLKDLSPSGSQRDEQ